MTIPTKQVIGAEFMTELEAIALVYGINIEEAKNIYVDDIPDDLYAEILELMKRDSEKHYG